MRPESGSTGDKGGGTQKVKGALWLLCCCEQTHHAKRLWRHESCVTTENDGGWLTPSPEAATFLTEGADEGAGGQLSMHPPRVTAQRMKVHSWTPVHKEEQEEWEMTTADLGTPAYWLFDGISFYDSLH